MTCACSVCLCGLSMPKQLTKKLQLFPFRLTYLDFFYYCEITVNCEKLSTAGPNSAQERNPNQKCERQFLSTHNDFRIILSHTNVCKSICKTIPKLF